jgi:hypothetical protein
MSLIFKALQRFGHHESIQSEAQNDSAHKRDRNTFTLRKILSSNIIVLLAAAGIFFAGLLLSQTVHFIPLRLKPQTPVVEAALQEKSPATDSIPTADPAAMGGGEPERSEPTQAYIPPEVTYQVHPPEQKNFMRPQVSATAAPPFLMPAQDGDSEKEADSQWEKAQSSAMFETFPRVSDDHPGDKRPVVRQWRKQENTNTTHQNPDISMVTHDAASPPISVTGDIYRGVPEIKRSTITEPDPQQRRVSEQATQHLTISRLANKIYSAIQADDVDLTSQLLLQLSNIKGAQNIFVLKLKAYSLIRQNQLKEARTILSHILAQRADDLEASLNMSVVDIKMGRYESARRRLVQLQGLYPEEDNVTLYLRKLPRP